MDPEAIRQIGYGELIDAADLAGVEVTQMGHLSGNARMRFLLAVSYMVEKRNDPDITWQDAQRWRVEVAKGKAPENPTPKATEG